MEKIVTVVFVALIILMQTACKDELSQPSASFEAYIVDSIGNIAERVSHGGTLEVKVGEQVNFVFTGSAGKVSIWTGDTLPGISHDYDKFIASGYDVLSYSGASLLSDGKPFTYSYSFPGTFKVMVVANNVGTEGEEVKSSVNFLYINVVDADNYFTRFFSFSLLKIGAVYGSSAEFLGDIEGNTVTIKVPGKANLSSSIANFQVAAGTQVFVNEVIQVNKLTENDFTSPITYTLIAFNGEVNEITVQVEKLEVITEALITSYAIDTFGITGSIDQSTGIIEVLFPFGTDLNQKYKASFTKSLYADVRIGSRPQNSGITSNYFNDTLLYKVKAEDTSVRKNYYVIPILGPGIASASFSGLVPLPVAKFNHGTHTVTFNVLAGTELVGRTLAITPHPADATMRVVEENGIATDRVFVSGVTTLNLSSEVKISVTDGENRSVVYRVIVNVISK